MQKRKRTVYMNVVRVLLDRFEKRFISFIGQYKEWLPLQRQNIIILILLVGVFVVLVSKHTTKFLMKEWEIKNYKNAFSMDTIDSYEKYATKYPEGKHISAVEVRLEELKAMPIEIYEINRFLNIRISKNSNGYWEAYNDEYGIELVCVPSGEFIMGQPYNKSKSHKVFLDSYWIGKFEVTNKQYSRFLNDLGISHKNYQKTNHSSSHPLKKIGTLKSYDNYFPIKESENFPVTKIDWYDAMAYCSWLSEKTGFEFKLPTEAQWEKAACWSEQSGKSEKHLTYPWGNLSPNKRLANYGGFYTRTLPVNCCPSGTSPYGILNMSGNVSEWCYDWFEEEYYSNSPYKNPTGPIEGFCRVYRGGSWTDNESSLRCSYRNRQIPKLKFSFLGFRYCTNFKKYNKVQSNK